MILPAMGVVSEIIPTFARKDIFGYKQIAISSLGIALIGYLVWGHHMFVSGISDTSRVVFSLLTFLVAIPTGVKVFNWVATLYKGSIKFSAPLYYVLAFIFIFSIGGLTGLVLGALEYGYSCNRYIFCSCALSLCNVRRNGSNVLRITSLLVPEGVRQDV